MKSVNDIVQTAKKIRFKPSSTVDKRILNSAKMALDNSRRSIVILNKFKRIVWAAGLAAAFIIISSLAACFILSRKNINLKNELDLARQDIATAPIDDSVTINFYLKEHQETISRYASHDLGTLQSAQMHLNFNDIMYYEFLDDQSEFLNSGMIVRGPSSQQEIESSEFPTISNGYTMTVSEARETANFNLLAPPRFHPGYKLDQIKRISGHDAMHLLYTNSINSVSLFEQPLDGQRGLSHHDFREYAVYNNQEEGKGTILAWRDDAISYVLLGNIEISQLMDIAQSISSTK